MRYQAPLNFVLLILKNGRGGAEIEVASKHDDFRPQAEWIALQSKLLVISVSDIKGA